MYVDIKEWGVSRNSLIMFCFLNRLFVLLYFFGYFCIFFDLIDNVMVYVGIE